MTWAVLFLVGLMLSRLLAGLISKLVRLTVLGWLDRRGGAVLGMALGTLVASVLLVAASQVPGGVKVQQRLRPLGRRPVHLLRGAQRLRAGARRLGGSELDAVWDRSLDQARETADKGKERPRNDREKAAEALRPMITLLDRTGAALAGRSASTLWAAAPVLLLEWDRITEQVAGPLPQQPGRRRPIRARLPFASAGPITLLPRTGRRTAGRRRRRPLAAADGPRRRPGAAAAAAARAPGGPRPGARRRRWPTIWTACASISWRPASGCPRWGEAAVQMCTFLRAERRDPPGPGSGRPHRRRGQPAAGPPAPGGGRPGAGRAPRSGAGHGPRPRARAGPPATR